MKKLFALTLAIFMLLTMVACSMESTKGTKDTKDENPIEEAIEDATGLLKKVWNGIDEDNRFFAYGGDAANMVDGEPGAYNLSDAESAKAQLVLSDEAAEMVDSASTLFHAMNANTFTAVSYKLKDGADRKDFANKMEDAIKNNQWICGFPEKLVIAHVADDYTIVAFGAGEIMDNFKKSLTTSYSSAEIVTETAL